MTEHQSARQFEQFVERNTELAGDMLRQAHLVTTDKAEQAGAMLTAAAVLIEQAVGRDQAGAVLVTLIAPTLADWQGPAPGEARH